jgi:hypothetical protein
VLQYLGRYTHRVAISNHRLVSFADGQVTFRWRDSANQNEQKLACLSHDKFLGRFLLHLLPQGFVRIRHFGFLASRQRATTLPLCFQLLAAAPEPSPDERSSLIEGAPDLYRCPKCGGPMKVVERLTAVEIQFRSTRHRSALPHEARLSNSSTPRASVHSVSLRLAAQRIVSSSSSNHPVRSPFLPSAYLWLAGVVCCALRHSFHRPQRHPSLN